MPAAWRSVVASSKGPLLRPRPAVERMAPYHPPTGGRMDRLRLDFNENTLGCSEKVTQFIAEHLVENDLAVYPEYGKAIEELAQFFKVEQNEFAITNGTDEAIQVLVNTYVDDGDDVIILKPSYAMYRFYCEVAGAEIREIEYRPGTLAFPLQELLGAIQPNTRLILISNPNNPTGAGVDLDGITRILRKAPNAAVLIDEAYYEFSGVTALKLINEYPNLFVSRTFSKVYGMAAMRVGCIFSKAENVAWMKKAQSPYSVNSLAVLAARAAIRDTEYISEYVGEVLAARELLYVGFEKLGIPYIKSQGNFVLFAAGDRSAEIRDTLREKGILVRDRSYEIPGCVRVTVGTREQMRKFLTELEAVWKRPAK
jgi:histidinol-phosphate aminotransferase